MNRAITHCLLFLFMGSQADGLVQLCAEWLCSKGRKPHCCHQTLLADSGPGVRAEAGHCSPAETATPRQLNRAICCEHSFDGPNSLFLTADRFPRDTFRQYLLSSMQPSDRSLSTARPGLVHSPLLRFLEDPSPPDLHSPVLRI